MGGKPKPPPPSEHERALAEKGAYQAAKHRQVYDPLAHMEYQDALTDDIRNLARARSNADAMQAAGKATFRQVNESGTHGTNLQAALQSGLQKADEGALQIQNKRLATGLQTANQQGADHTSAMSTLATIGAKEAIGKMQRDVEESSAKAAAIGQIATAAGAKYSPQGSGMEKFFSQIGGFDPADLGKAKGQGWFGRIG